MKLYNLLKPGYQKRVVDKNVSLVKEILNETKKGIGRQVTVSPTGSGKTFMMASIIEFGLSLPESPCFVWLTHNKQILSQTQNELSDALGSYLTPVSDIEKNVSSFGRLLLFNVQKGVSEKSKTWLKRWKTFQKDAGREVVFIVDEADEGMSGANMEGLRKALRPCVELGFTASFKKRENEFEFERVNYDEVIEAGMLTHQIYWQASDEVDRKEMMMRAIAQRDLLEKYAYMLKTIHRFFMPKMLIQTKASEAESVARELKSLANLSDEDFKKYVVVHIQESRGLDQIEREAFENVRFIIGDLMVERGWNCPEAYVLLSTKDTVSRSKGIQLMGRVIRLPGCEPFDENFDLFNSAYVYISGNHSIIQSCENFKNGDEGIVLPPPKEFVQVQKREDLNIPNILSFKNDLVGDIESEEYYSITDKICSILQNYLKDCANSKPTVIDGSLHLNDSSYSVNLPEEVENEWDVEQAKRILIDTLSKKMPRSYANLVVLSFQIKHGNFSEVARVIKPFVKKIEEGTLIDKITNELSYVYREHEWPSHKLVQANPLPLSCKFSLYPKIFVNSEEKLLVLFLEKFCEAHNCNWVRNDPSDIKIIKGHYPDFIVFNQSKFVFIEFKGKHLLNNLDSIKKNALSRMSANYYMVYLDKKSSKLIIKNLEFEKDEEFTFEHLSVFV